MGKAIYFLRALSVCVLGMCFLVAWSGVCAAAKPNILIILADDLGYADVGFNDGKTIKTPNLDRFARGAIRLRDFRACPMCSPTRAGLMTGRWPIRFGMMRSVVPPWSTNGMPSSEKTLAELLAPAGYAQRAIIGKWHLGHENKSMLPLSQGFTLFYGHYNGAIDYFDHTREGETDWHKDERTVKEEGYSTDLLGAAAAQFIANAPVGKPWLLYLPFNAPHSPFQAKHEALMKYPNLKMADRRAYAAMVDCLDQAVGKVLDEVERRLDAANTLVVFFSDNGGLPRVGSNVPWRGGKLTVYEGGTRVAAAIRWPAGGIGGGKTFDGRIGYIDVLPTLLAAANVKPPDDLDGLNFLPALRGEARLPERPWFSYMHQSEKAEASVHEGPWKLIAHGDVFSRQPGAPLHLELYNLKTDPGEANNVTQGNPEVTARLVKALKEFGALQAADGHGYDFGREGFKAPKDWLIQ